jgi:hypothetical protein
MVSSLDTSNLASYFRDNARYLRARHERKFWLILILALQGNRKPELTFFDHGWVIDT